MKRFLPIILIIIIVLLSGPIQDVFNDINEQRQIEKYEPTEQEIETFKEIANDNTYYYYNSLGENEKKAYITMYSSFMNFDDSFVMEISHSKAKEVFTAVLYDNPHIFWVDNEYVYVENNNSIEFTPSYRHTPEQAREISEQLDSKIEGITSSVNALSSEYEKELYIHNYVCENTIYDENSEDGDSAYEALLEGKAICEGYSRAIQILLDAVDIDNYLIVGNGTTDGKTEPHMWNVVSIDGESYHLDSTWNDTCVEDMVAYFYFNVTDEYIKRDHSDFEPVNNFCFSDSANYFVIEKANVDSYSRFGTHINRSAETLKEGQNYVEFFFVNPTDYQKAIKDIENDNGFFNYVSSAVSQSGRNLDSKKIDYYTVEDYNYLCIVFKER